MSQEVKFDSYRLSYSTEPYKYRAVITCYAGDKQVGALKFFSSATTIEPNKYVNGKIIICFDLNEFERIYPILLHEKPLYLYISDDFKIGIIRTDPNVFEPVGEEE